MVHGINTSLGLGRVLAIEREVLTLLLAHEIGSQVGKVILKTFGQC
jgi:hypothetical protein